MVIKQLKFICLARTEKIWCAEKSVNVWKMFE